MQQWLEFCLEVIVVWELVHHLPVVVTEHQHDALHTRLELLHVVIPAVHNSVTNSVLLLQSGTSSQNTHNM
jgi:hypothetical protein